MKRISDYENLSEPTLWDPEVSGTIRDIDPDMYPGESEPAVVITALSVLSILGLVCLLFKICGL